MESFSLKLSKGVLSCRRFGHGPELLIAFHGYNERAAVFEALEPALAAHFTMVAPDLPFHGETAWNSDDFSRDDLIEMVQHLQQHAGNARYSLMGFSLGAQMVQSLTPILAVNLNQVILLAPEPRGLALATMFPKWLRKACFRLVKIPGFVERIVHLPTKTGMISEKTRQFLKSHTSRSARFERLLKYWVSADAFRVSPEAFRRVVTDFRLSVQVYFGTEDSLIRPKSIQKQFGKIPGAIITPLPVGHRLIGPALARQLLDKAVNPA